PGRIADRSFADCCSASRGTRGASGERSAASVAVARRKPIQRCLVRIARPSSGPRRRPAILSVSSLVSGNKRVYGPNTGQQEEARGMNMTNIARGMFGSCAALILAASLAPVSAQSNTTGALQGKVIDEGKAVLPGTV